MRLVGLLRSRVHRGRDLFLALFVLLGPVVLPLKVVLVNLLSISAAFGAVTYLVVQGCWAWTSAAGPTRRTMMGSMGRPSLGGTL